MTPLEIFMIVIGLAVIILSFAFSEHMHDKKEIADESIDVKNISRETIRAEIQEEVNNFIEDTVEKTHIALDKVMNEKISAINDFSKDVLVEIKKNHDEVIFLYDMLNDKEKVVKNTVRDVEAAKVSLAKIKEEEPVIDDVVQQKKIEKKVLIKASNVKNLTNNNDRILELYGKGMTNVDIAKELGLGIGEVRLVIDLFRSKRGQ